MIEPHAADAPSRARADRDAIDWLIALQEAPGDAALGERFATWHQADPVHAAAWAEIGEVSRLIGAVRRPPTRRIRRDWLGPRIETQPRRPLRRVLLLAAATAAACLAFVATPGWIIRTRADVVAGTGNMKTVRLADESVVRLAAGAALAIDFSASERKVRLLRGDGYFDVAHDPARPFRVETGDTVTTVLGTAFEIRKGAESVDIAVRRGRVAVGCNGRPATTRLGVGQTLALACGVRSEKSTVNPSRVAPWVEGRLVAADRPMGEVIDGLRPWYGGIIIAHGAAINMRRVTGVYHLHRPEQALGALAAAHGAHVRRITPWILIISAD